MSSFNCVEQGQFALLDFVRQRRVVERRRDFLTFGDRPFQKGDELRAVVGTLLLLVK